MLSFPCIMAVIGVGQLDLFMVAEVDIPMTAASCVSRTYYIWFCSLLSCLYLI